MPRFAANLTMLWPELDVYDRFRAAAQAGFRRVEILFVHELDPARVARLLEELRLELVLFDPAPGNWAKGERGLLSVPGREEEFLGTVREAIASALRYGTRLLNCLAGIPPAGVARDIAQRTAVENLRAAAPLGEKAGVTILVEAINSIDMPGYFADTVDKAAALVEAAASPHVRLQLDQYHAGMAGTDPRAALGKHAALVRHVQIADVPGRNQPGTGTQPIAGFLEDLDGMGYAGSVGLEYRPRGGMEEALAWLPRERRG
ncbi:MAG TPA: TIM barrel protein [Myxococcales bacterium]|nr:TIM barrel protein [Myxococcales bacterium]